MKILHLLLKATVINLILFSCPGIVTAQDSLTYEHQNVLSDKFLRTEDAKNEKLLSSIDRSQEKYFRKLSASELKLKRKLMKKDSVAAKEIFGDVTARYESLRSSSAKGISAIRYNGHLDSMNTAVRFLSKAGDANLSDGQTQKTQALISQYGDVQKAFNSTSFIDEQLKERQRFLKEKLQNTPFARDLVQFKKQVYYYRAKIDECKNVFEKPEKLEENLLSAAQRFPGFRKFYAKNSLLSTLFRLPSEDVDQESLSGLQTQPALQKLLDNRFGKEQNTTQLAQKQASAGQAQAEALKNKLKSGEKSSGDPEMPNFQPNNQKTKRLRDRLEIGTTMQSGKGSSILPTTSDVGLSIGYKLNDKSTAGIGSSYKMGWGKDIRHIQLSHEGIGFKTFVDYKIKGSFWFSTGGELTYYSGFRNLEVFHQLDSWQKAILAGLTKKIKMRSMGASVEALYDFLHARHLPQSQPFMFRVNYQLK